MNKELKYDAILFDLDDTLYNSTLMSNTARKNAIRAIREAGLEISEDEAFNLLAEIVKKYGSNYNEHFNRLLEELGFEIHPKLIAAAVVAYHSEKYALLRPFPDVIITLLTLMKNYKIGIISDGIQEKQWEKLIYLGIQHFFDVVIINDLPSRWKPSQYGYKMAMEKLKLKNPKRIIYIGNRIDTDITGANKVGMISVLFDPNNMIKIDNLTKEEKPTFIIQRISDISKIIGIEEIKWHL